MLIKAVVVAAAVTIVSLCRCVSHAIELRACEDDDPPFDLPHLLDQDGVTRFQPGLQHDVAHLVRQGSFSIVFHGPYKSGKSALVRLLTGQSPTNRSDETGPVLTQYHHNNKFIYAVESIGFASRHRSGFVRYQHEPLMKKGIDQTVDLVRSLVPVAPLKRIYIVVNASMPPPGDALLGDYKEYLRYLELLKQAYGQIAMPCLRFLVTRCDDPYSHRHHIYFKSIKDNIKRLFSHVFQTELEPNRILFVSGSQMPSRRCIRQLICDLNDGHSDDDIGIPFSEPLVMKSSSIREAVKSSSVYSAACNGLNIASWLWILWGLF